MLDLNFSIFDDDGTLGGLENSRVVVLRGSTTPSQLFSPNFFPIDSYIRTALVNAGFDVIAVRSSSANFFGYALNIEIEINVFNNFTAEEARRNAVRAIEAYTANYGLNRVFSNTTLSVVSDAYRPPGQAPRSRGVIDNPPSQYDQSGGKAVTGDSQNPFNFGTALGITTPIALVGGGLLLLLLLKR